MEKIFKCICGKTFTNSQSFNAHKSHCQQHQLNKYGNLDIYNSRNKHISESLIKTNDNKRRLRKEQQLQQWLNEQHTCERCGKVMIQFYGSGRFCSRACANTRQHTQETKQKISNFNKGRRSISIRNIDNTEKRIQYENSPNYCVICGKKLDFAKKHKKTCSYDCLVKRLSMTHKGKTGGYIPGSGSKNFKKGWYKGFYCDSTWELAYVIYNLDHNIKFKRCKRVYEYEYNGEKHKYYPDFELEDGSLVEIKGYMNGRVYVKLKAVKDRPIKLLTGKDLQYVFDYIKETYKCTHLWELYD